MINIKGKLCEQVQFHASRGRGLDLLIILLHQFCDTQHVFCCYLIALAAIGRQILCGFSLSPRPVPAGLCPGQGVTSWNFSWEGGCAA